MSRFAFKTGLILAVGFLLSSDLLAQTVTLDFGGQGSFTSRLVAILGGITILSLAPSILVMMTSFTRMVVVFSFLRNAMGLQQSPPNIVIISLSLFLTGFVMSPALEKSYEEGLKPYMNEQIQEEEAFDKVTSPIKDFMYRNTREKDLVFVSNLAPQGKFKSEKDVALKTLIPAFMLSEIKRAFEIGFLLYLPFVVIDMVVASVVMAMGMMMLPPMMISLPIKVIFFVMIDGWNLVVGSLVQGFR